MAITLKINTVDKSNQVDWSSVQIQEVLTKEPDSLTFSLKNYDGKTYQPALGDEVEVLDGATPVFGGIIVNLRESINGMLRFLTVDCKDYTQTLDRRLVAESYENQTADFIINDILTNYCVGFTDTNVNAPIVVKKIVFNYMPVSEALKKLAKTLGNYDWYVDYSKDIHFFVNGANTAPFALTDTSGTFIWNSLILEENLAQVRNRVIVRGGDVQGDLVTNIQVMDGVQRVIFVGYSLDLSSLLIQKALAGTPTTFVTQTVGADGKDNPASFNCLYNPNDGLIIYPDGTKPAVNDRIKSEGYPIFPLIATKSDLVSQGIYGDYEYLIVDKTVRSKPSASQMAGGELTKYSTPSHRGEFQTYSSGLRSGQIILVNSTIRNVNRSYLIDRITAQLYTPDKFIYTVSILASEDVTMVDVLNKIIGSDVTDQISVGENEVVDTLYEANETLTLTETYTISQSHNPSPETITMTELDIEQPLDYPTAFVWAPYQHTLAYNGADAKRVFLWDCSPLG